MELIPTNPTHNPSKSETEQVQQQKHEYYLLGSFIRTRGLKLFAYNWQKDEIFEVEVKKGSTITAVPMDGKLVAVDKEQEKCFVDSRNKFFECLNMANAVNRVKKFKQGKIKELCNLLRAEDVKPIKFW